MPREILTIQVGQCGNQIGRCFWMQALTEHASGGASHYDDSMSTFFRNVKHRTNEELPTGSRLSSLKARAILVDMEDGVVSETIKGPIGELFDRKSLVTNVYGSGNNWANGFSVHGTQYKDELLESIRGALEQCDSIQSFQLIHSTGGGTGSGLGTFILSLLEENFSPTMRMVTSIFPSEDDDVVTSPYNTILGLKYLTEKADIVLPIDNDSLRSISKEREIISCKNKESVELMTRSGGGGIFPKRVGFDSMNAVVADMLTDVTASARFPGSLNVDMNDLYTNLVPFPRIKYIVASMAPLSTRNSGKIYEYNDDISRLCSEALKRSNQMMSCDITGDRFVACALLARGNISICEANLGLKKMKGSMDMTPWNRDGFKVGLCSVPPPGHSRSILLLANNCAVAGKFSDLKKSFMKLYDRKAMLHHYTQFVEDEVFEEALESVSQLIDEYRQQSVYEQPTPEPWPLHPVLKY